MASGVTQLDVAYRPQPLLCWVVVVRVCVCSMLLGYYDYLLPSASCCRPRGLFSRHKLYTGGGAGI